VVNRLVLRHCHGGVSADVTGVAYGSLHVEDLALPKSLKGGNFASPRLSFGESVLFSRNGKHVETSRC
jgi:hypothetical protein